MAAKFPQQEVLSSVQQYPSLHTAIPFAKVKLLLSEAVNQILTPWPALVFAIENSFGGPDTREKAIWMKTVIIDYILNRKSLDIDELEDYILNIMETEFNTLIEDGSCNKLCESMIRVYGAVLLNDTSGIEQILSPFRLLVRQSDKAPKSSSMTQLEFPDKSDTIQHAISTHLDRPARKVTEKLEDILPPEGLELPQSTAAVGIPEHRFDTDALALEDMDTSGEWEVVTRSKKKKRISSYLTNT